MVRTLQEVALSVKRLQHRHHRALNAALADLEISLVQWDALRHLDRHPEASLHDLAQLTFQTDQSFGALASRMIERGLIERVPGPGRAIRHRLTDRGQTLRQAGASRVDQVLARSFASLSPEQLTIFGNILVQLLDPSTEAAVNALNHSSTSLPETVDTRATSEVTLASRVEIMEQQEATDG